MTLGISSLEVLSDKHSATNAFLLVYTFRNLLGLLQSAIMLQTSTLEINV